MKKKFTTPKLEMIYNSGSLTTDQLTGLSEKKLNSYVSQCARQTYQISPDYILRNIGGSDVVVPVGSHLNPAFESCMLMLNQTASFLWKLFQQPITEAEAVRQCKQHFDGPVDSIEWHICNFIQQLLERGVLLKHNLQTEENEKV